MDFRGPELYKKSSFHLIATNLDIRQRGINRKYDAGKLLVAFHARYMDDEYRVKSTNVYSEPSLICARKTRKDGMPVESITSDTVSTGQIVTSEFALA